MAQQVLTQIAGEAAERFGAVGIAIEHRIGRLELGETSVGIAVAHPHRAPAFDAARFMIEELKRSAPIWKLEHYVDGTREWVEAGSPQLERSG
jgi:molybdopterin synthase catalytic subunit